MSWYVISESELRLGCKRGEYYDFYGAVRISFFILVGG